MPLDRSELTMLVLLTGAGGFVGHHTLAHLLKTTDWNFVATDSFRHFGISSRIRAVFEELPHEASRVKVVTHDLTTPIDAITAREFGNPDVIINMASDSHVDRSITNPRPFVENNVSLVLTLLEYARTLPNLKTFIQIGTDEVYGPAPSGINHPEWSPQIPSNPYSASKSAQEAIAISYWRTFNIPVVLTNTMNIIGERQDVEKFVPLVITVLNKVKPLLFQSSFFVHSVSVTQVVFIQPDRITNSNILILTLIIPIINLVKFYFDFIW